MEKRCEMHKYKSKYKKIYIFFKSVQNTPEVRISPNVNREIMSFHVKKKYKEKGPLSVSLTCKKIGK